MLEEVLSSYEISKGAAIQLHGSGLINSTWKIADDAGEYVLQKINDEVFKQPNDIAYNIEAIASWLNNYHPEYLFIAPVKTKSGDNMVHNPHEGYFRLFPFIKGSHTNDIANTPEQAFEAAKQFGLFTQVLKNFPVENLKITIPDFHNLIFRDDRFKHALKHGNPSRMREARETIDFLTAQDHIVSTYKKIISNREFKRRVTHHDTKISNVLFDKREKGICVIDLDTIMPGYFISDVGDMMRTYLSPVSEEEKNFKKIVIREDYFEAIARGYLQQMKEDLSPPEIQHFVYAGLFMIYMQALRFLTDYLENDKYYGASYDGHNYVRAKNQATLLARLLEKKQRLDQITAETSEAIF
jgi:Ser/Thr protein kinase RdoA (MazF antagonist)